jgi:hypothetical protein
MWRFTAISVLLLASYSIRCDAKARSKTGPAAVSAGDRVPFVVELNQAPQFEGGRLQAIACPVDPVRAIFCRPLISTPHQTN